MVKKYIFYMDLFYFLCNIFQQYYVLFLFLLHFSQYYAILLRFTINFLLFFPMLSFLHQAFHVFVHILLIRVHFLHISCHFIRFIFYYFIPSRFASNPSNSILCLFASKSCAFTFIKFFSIFFKLKKDPDNLLIIYQNLPFSINQITINLNPCFLFSHQLLRLFRDTILKRSTPAATIVKRSHLTMSVSSPVFGDSFLCGLLGFSSFGITFSVAIGSSV